MIASSRLSGAALAAALLLAPRVAPGQRVVDGAARARIDSTLRAFVASGTVAGVSALIHEQGREVYFNAFGMADRERGRPMARDAIVQIFSMTKPVTGVALMTLVEQGKVALDDPLAKYLPELADLRVWSGTDAAGNPVLAAPRRAPTVRDVTRHTAGFATGSSSATFPCSTSVRSATPVTGFVIEKTCTIASRVIGRRASRSAIP